MQIFVRVLKVGNHKLFNFNSLVRTKLRGKSGKFPLLSTKTASTFLQVVFDFFERGLGVLSSRFGRCHRSWLAFFYFAEGIDVEFACHR